jgi:hypothetical protein
MSTSLRSLKKTRWLTSASWRSGRSEHSTVFIFTNHLTLF